MKVTNFYIYPRKETSTEFDLYSKTHSKDYPIAFPLIGKPRHNIPVAELLRLAALRFMYLPRFIINITLHCRSRHVEGNHFASDTFGVTIM